MSSTSVSYTLLLLSLWPGALSASTPPTGQPPWRATWRRTTRWSIAAASAKQCGAIRQSWKGTRALTAWATTTSASNAATSPKQPTSSSSMCVCTPASGLSTATAAATAANARTISTSTSGSSMHRDRPSDAPSARSPPLTRLSTAAMLKSTKAGRGAPRKVRLGQVRHTRTFWSEVGAGAGTAGAPVRSWTCPPLKPCSLSPCRSPASGKMAPQPRATSRPTARSPHWRLATWNSTGTVTWLISSLSPRSLRPAASHSTAPRPQTPRRPSQHSGPTRPRSRRPLPRHSNTPSWHTWDWQRELRPFDHPRPFFFSSTRRFPVSSKPLTVPQAG